MYFFLIYIKIKYMTNEERLTMQMNRNVRLSPWVLALTWDPAFIWTISTMFLSQVRAFSYSQIIMLDSYLMLFGALFCVPVAKLFKKASPIKTIRLGLLCYGAFLLLYIFGTKYYIVNGRRCFFRPEYQ